ncbi:hypothetical protein HanXRQr2_Chr03g0123701 [Helianthus annuus]|uniref:Uncharacterized protein n=1 Tax=Helianthus annuus TaxID=4232 RepID=A0A9K3JHY2_HELAN|nr:hypothetical protein HanXRQr2_Chr03g0123701 [Helianthus annuus]
MLTCITCSKQQIEDGGEEVGARGTPSSKETVKSLTAQVSFPTLILSNLHYTLMSSSSYVAKGLFAFFCFLQALFIVSFYYLFKQN